MSLPSSRSSWNTSLHLCPLPLPLLTPSQADGPFASPHLRPSLHHLSQKPSFPRPSAESPSLRPPSRYSSFPSCCNSFSPRSFRVQYYRISPTPDVPSPLSPSHFITSTNRLLVTTTNISSFSLFFLSSSLHLLYLFVWYVLPLPSFSSFLSFSFCSSLSRSLSLTLIPSLSLFLSPNVSLQPSQPRISANSMILPCIIRCFNCLVIRLHSLDLITDNSVIYKVANFVITNTATIINIVTIKSLVILISILVGY